jgi:RNA-binding protein
MPLSSKERAALRAEAHHLSASVHVGQHGLTDAVIQTIDDALRTRELVKIQLPRSGAMDAKEAANEIAVSLRADVVQVIGKTATLFRENPELERKDGVPPWHR